MKTAVGAVAAIALALGLILGGAFGVSASSACTTGTIDPAQAGKLSSVAGYQGDQLSLAAVVLNMVAVANVDSRAGAIAISIAMTRSGLRNLADGQDIGIYRLGTAYGTDANRLNPQTATLRLLSTMTARADWLTAAPATVAANTVPGTTASEYEATYADAAAVAQVLRATAATCSIGDDPVALAQELVEAANAGQLRGLVPDHIKEIRWIAQSREVPDCGIDTSILQIIVIAVRNFDSVTISDINRRCTGQIVGAGTSSPHWLGGGGHAVDFATLNGTALTGADGNSIRLINLLDPIVPNGARIGQIECRSARGIHVQPANFRQYVGDTCNHLHVDTYFATQTAGSR